MSAIAGWSAIACISGWKREWRGWQENTTNGRRDKSGSLRFRKPLLSHGFLRAGRSGRVPRPMVSPMILTVFPALSARSLAGDRR